MDSTVGGRLLLEIKVSMGCCCRHLSNSCRICPARIRPRRFRSFQSPATRGAGAASGAVPCCMWTCRRPPSVEGGAAWVAAF